MFEIDPDTKQIFISRGQAAALNVKTKFNNVQYTFKVDDVVRFTVFKKKKYDTTILTKEVVVSEENETVVIPLNSEDTELFALVNKPTDFYYEIELNPDTSNSQMILCHDKKTGPKIFTLYPTGGKR